MEILNIENKILKFDNWKIKKKLMYKNICKNSMV